MATLALSLKDTDTLNGGGGTSTVSAAAMKQFDSPSSVFASGSITSLNRIPGGDSTCSQVRANLKFFYVFTFVLGFRWHFIISWWRGSSFGKDSKYEGSPHGHANG